MTRPASNACTPMQITAHMAGGVATAHPWGLALDGLLAAQLWRDHAATSDPATLQWPSQTDTPPDLPLPLHRCTTAGELWHWSATCAYTDAPASIEVRRWTARLDHAALETLTATLPKNLSPSKGRYRTRQMPLFVTLTNRLTWRAVGDPSQVADLLSPISAIGKKRSQGEGRVLRWTVEPIDIDPWDAGHLHPDQSLGRPVPACCAGALPDSPTMLAGIRPPYMHPGRQHQLHVPVR